MVFYYVRCGVQIQFTIFSSSFSNILSDPIIILFIDFKLNFSFKQKFGTFFLSLHTANDTPIFQKEMKSIVVFIIVLISWRQQTKSISNVICFAVLF